MTEQLIKQEEVIVKIVNENWRLMKLFMKVLTKLELSEQNRYMNQIRYFQKSINDNLDEVGLKIVNLEGTLYDAGMAASPLNLEDFTSDDVLYVDQMIEPLIMGDSGIKKEGIVKLIKVKK